MRYRFLLVCLIVVLPVYSTTAEPDGQAALDHFVGNWHSVLTDEPTQTLPDGAKRTAREYTSWALNKRFIIGREIVQPGEVKLIWLVKYDPQTKQYPSWYFDSNGTLGAELDGTWDDETKTMTHRWINLPKDLTGLGTNHFQTNSTTNTTFWVKDQADALMYGSDGEKTRQPEEAGPKILSAWSQSTRREGDYPSPQHEVMERMIGTWEVTSIFKVSEWTPQEEKFTSKGTRTWVLNGTFALLEETRSDGYSSMSLMTWDPNQKIYRSWRFSSEGYTTESTGQWDEVAETFSFVSHKDGRTTRVVGRFIDHDHHDWRVVTTGEDGKVYFDGKWICTRAQEADERL